MPILINASSNTSQVAMLFKEYADKFPKDLATALTRTAKGAKQDLVSQVDKYIDRPTPFTKMGFFFKGASAKTLEAEVGTKEPTDYYRKFHHLQSQIFGKNRAIRGSERRLRATGLISSSEYLAPGPAMTKSHLDQYGNMRGQKMVQLLSQIRNLSIEGESGFEANRKEGEASKAFFGIINGHKGIWERRGKRNIRLMVSVINEPRYAPKFPMIELIEQYFNANIEREFWKAYEQGKEIRARKGL